jgi:hypothetical protein
LANMTYAALIMSSTKAGQGTSFKRRRRFAPAGLSFFINGPR